MIEKHGPRYVAYVEEIRGVNTQGRTLTEAHHNLRETLQLIPETHRRLARAHASCLVRREAVRVET